MVLLRLFDVKNEEPLVGEWIEVQFVTCLPIVEGSAKLNTVVSRSPVREGKGVRNLVEGKLIEGRHDAVDFKLILSNIFFVVFSGSIINFLEDLTLLVTSEDLLDDTDWHVVLWAPCWELRLEVLDDGVVNEDLALESEEFTKPCLADHFSIHSGLPGVLSQLQVLWLVSESSNSSLHGSDEVTGAVTLEGISRTGLTIPKVLQYGVFETSSLEGDNWCATHEELVLDNTSWLKGRWHEAEVSTSVHK